MPPGYTTPTNPCLTPVAGGTPGGNMPPGGMMPPGCTTPNPSGGPTRTALSSGGPTPTPDAETGGARGKIPRKLPRTGAGEGDSTNLITFFALGFGLASIMLGFGLRRRTRTNR